MFQFYLLFSYARSEILIHKTSELKAIFFLGNLKIFIQNFQVNKKIDKNVTGKRVWN